VKIYVEENEIRIRNAPVQGDLFNKMRGLGESLFEDNAVTLQKNLRSEWKI
jgi:hypothetical protein